MDGIGRLGHDPPRGPSADWWVLTTADAAGTNGLTCLPKHGGARDKVVRLWPSAIAMDRVCSKDYNLGKPNNKCEKDYIIRKGEGVLIPVWCVHRDPKFYPQPDKFDPERFSEENKHRIQPFTYIPFGLGPRNCIGKIHHHHHQPINVPTAGAQAFPMDGTGRLGRDPPRGPSADWWVLTTADATGTNGLTCLPKHGGARDSKFLVTHPMTDHCETDDFRGFSSEFKFSWICPACRCKEPKSGNNCNTPVRPASQTQPLSSTVSHYDNVTLRTKQKVSVSGTTAPIRGSPCSCLTASDIRTIIREELCHIKTEINADLQEIVKSMTSFEASLSFYNEEFEKIKAITSAQNNTIETLRKENEFLRNTTQELSARVRQLDQQTRAANLEIQCVPEHKQENLVNVVMQLGKVIKCPITDTDIYYCSRVAKMNTNNTRPRSILVKFRSPRLRESFLAATSTFNKNNPDNKLNTSHLGLGEEKKSAVFVVEHLTLENEELHAAARRKSKELQFKFVWVREGKIFMRKSDESNYIYVRNHDTLKKLS
ncbi:hypothetical protein evm_014988 [Chilo suppressalis]|nr:hypothetical protein evm_014988 [Chilo suppressalis]